MNRTLALLTLCLLSAVTVSTSSGSPQSLVHERLRLRNNFATPEEVVSYYCARDASGFVWSGLLEVERKAFTLWEDVPQHDSFFVAKRYEIAPGQKVDPQGSRAQVLVKYELVAISDAHGTRMPPPNPEYGVTFELQKVDGAWKIAGPSPQALAPVVLEAKFPN